MITKQKILFVFVLLVASSHNAYSFYSTSESQCSPIDLRAEFPLKMRNQGDISWCYAHAAADYLQFYNRVPVQISAADIAMNYNRRRWPRFLRWLQGGVVPETGFIRSAIWDISSVGYCPEEYFPSEKWVKRIMTGKNAGESVEVPIAKAIKEIISLEDRVSDEIYVTPSDLPYVYEFKGVSHQQFFEAIFDGPSGNMLEDLRSAACDANRTPFPKVIADIEMSFKGRNPFSSMNRIMDQHQPLTVDFFYGFLENIDHYSHALSELHTTVLMGRRFNAENQECQYLVKNSYGTDCSSYDHRHQCEGGYVWVSESSLYGAMTSYEYISNSEADFTQIASQTQHD